MGGGFLIGHKLGTTDYMSIYQRASFEYLRVYDLVQPGEADPPPVQFRRSILPQATPAR